MQQSRSDRRPGIPTVLYEDAEIVVLDKPVGLPVIAPEGGRGRTVLDFVTERLKRRNPRARAAVVHRLDRDTSGVMVVACNARAKKTLMDGWAERARDRRYVALVEGVMGAEKGVLDSWLVEAGPSRMRIAAPGERGALRALATWTRIGEGSGFSLVEVSLETGRRHQIRVQLASIGHPVAGDERYGSRRDPGGRLMLHASILELVHPISGEAMRFESPPPQAFTAALRSGPARAAGPARPASSARPTDAARQAGLARPNGPAQASGVARPSRPGRPAGPKASGRPREKAKRPRPSGRPKGRKTSS
ncbi:MAG TPA: RluA family pseudouridine synthase [Rectinemataceae bacterium]|nr:RluA family pseudouridine synthase [Rectinemataceae bacterium]